MAYSIFLYLCVFYFTSLHFISTLSKSDNYIIHMDLSAMPKAFTNQHSWYHSTLSQVISTTNNNILKSTSSKIIYTYTNVINGFSANLSPEEHEALKKSPGYISSMPDLPVTLDTTHSPEFLGLNPYKGAWHDSNYGKDVIIGMVDTGVWPESKSFNDNGMTEIPSRWKGKCEFEVNTSFCNKKLIGARYFNKGFLAANPSLASEVKNSSRDDTEGHGTHTASTAGGNHVDGASFFGYANGTARGTAPLARIAVYKAAWGQGLAVSSDVIAAIDAAILDGVDVLSISLGLSNVGLSEDPIAIGSFAAMEKGILVSTSSGNNGPKFQTLHNGVPWVINVAASTLDRQFQGKVTLGNGVSVSGFSNYIGNFSTKNFPIVDLGFCQNEDELAKAKNKIVLCQDTDDGNFLNLVYQVLNAKNVGAIFISESKSDDLLDIVWYILPSITVNNIDGKIVKDYIKSNSKSIAKILYKQTSFGIKPAPSVDDYSSRGPSKSCPYVLKPDITAPGTSILAAWPAGVPVLDLETSTVYNDFNAISGTSMSTPHVSGIAALIKGAHPDWSPAAIRSALMTTSDTFDNTKQPIKDIGDGNNAATPLAMGAGHVNPNRALDPGLVYDAGVQDYVNLLCALNFTQQQITTITRSSSNDCSKPSLDINYPSFIAFFNSEKSSSIQEFHRTVTNLGEGKTVYVASVTPIKGFNVTVIPNKLTFNQKNEKMSYKLRIENTGTTKEKNVAFGFLTWNDVKHVVRSPIVVSTQSF
ncbi:subtilisin-like protease SBT3 [Cicer arietinum]|uniref:Subtilisin-like protease SBT1.9 n=1 Tax=Cicer arietinum TaxID=3827 RepID=A0A1S3EIA9_CICAR|nr:subtilisin-like protease SBT1.9 [Cicer arietinum]